VTGNVTLPKGDAWGAGGRYRWGSTTPRMYVFTPAKPSKNYILVYIIKNVIKRNPVHVLRDLKKSKCFYLETRDLKISIFKKKKC
jgi:hypothetical protein